MSPGPGQAEARLHAPNNAPRESSVLPQCGHPEPLSTGASMARLAPESPKTGDRFGREKPTLQPQTKPQQNSSKNSQPPPRNRERILLGPVPPRSGRPAPLDSTRAGRDLCSGSVHLPAVSKLGLPDPRRPSGAAPMLISDRGVPLRGHPPPFTAFSTC